MASLRLPACEESLAAFREFALAEGARAGLAQDTLNRVELVLEEALVNVIRHAYAAAPAGCERQVELSCGVDADGVTEAMNPAQELYGEPRLLARAERFGETEARERCESIAAEVHAFAAGAEQSDDITLLALIYCGPEDDAN